MTSMVEKVASSSIATSVTNITVGQNTSIDTSSNTTAVETLFRNSPKCTGAQQGWAFDNYTNVCQVPPEVSCYAPMDSWVEKFESTDFDKTVWRGPAPEPWPLKDPILVCHTESYWCWDWGWWWWWWFDICFIEVCEWKVPDGFLRGANFTFGTVPGSVPKACSDCGNFLTIDSRAQEFTRLYKGMKADFVSSRPQLITFRSRTDIPASNGLAHNDIVFLDDGADRTSTDDDKFIFHFYHYSNYMLIYNGDKWWQTQFNASYWYEVNIVVNWDTTTIDWWLRQWADSNTPRAWTSVQQGIPFTNAKASGISSAFVFSYGAGSVSHFDEIKFCNSVSGPKYVPVSTTTAIQAATAKFRQTVNGKLDYSFEQSFSSYSFSQSHNYRLKGGDSSIVNLLDLRKTTDTFETWKLTVPQNPAVVSYTLQEVSSLVPDEEFDQINIRNAMKAAVRGFLRDVQVRDILVDSSPDDPNSDLPVGR